MITDLSVLKFIIGFFIVFEVLIVFFSSQAISFHSTMDQWCVNVTGLLRVNNQQLDMLAVSIGPGKFTPRFETLQGTSKSFLFISGVKHVLMNLIS